MKRVIVILFWVVSGILTYLDTLRLFLPVSIHINRNNYFAGIGPYSLHFFFGWFE